MKAIERKATIFGLFAAAALCANVSAQNLLPNGDFSSGLQISGWSLSTPSGSLSYSSNDAQHSSTSGSLELGNVGTSAVTANSACFSVQPGLGFSIGGEYASTWVVGPGTFGEASFACSYFTTTDCSGTGVSVATSGSIDYTQPFGSFGNVTGTLPSNAQSARCSVSAQVDSIGQNGDPPLTVDFDNLSFATSPATMLGGYMSGNWYDASNSGEGFQLEFTAQQNALLAIWFTFAADGTGTPIWIYAQGPYDPASNTVTLPAFYSHGASFPPGFHSGDVSVDSWGSLTFTFSDCNHGTAAWAPTRSGFTAGSMSISRLTSIAGTFCPQ